MENIKFNFASNLLGVRYESSLLVFSSYGEEKGITLAYVGMLTKNKFAIDMNPLGDSIYAKISDIVLDEGNMLLSFKYVDDGSVAYYWYGDSPPKHIKDNMYDRCVLVEDKYQYVQQNIVYRIVSGVNKNSIGLTSLVNTEKNLKIEVFFETGKLNEMHISQYGQKNTLDVVNENGTLWISRWQNILHPKLPIYKLYLIEHRICYVCEAGTFEYFLDMNKDVRLIIEELLLTVLPIY